MTDLVMLSLIAAGVIAAVVIPLTARAPSAEDTALCIATKTEWNWKVRILTARGWLGFRLVVKLFVFVDRHCGEQGRLAVREWFQDELPEFGKLWEAVKRAGVRKARSEMKLIRGGRYGE